MALVADRLDPRLHRRLRGATPARRWVVSTVERAAKDPLRATARLREAQRGARSLRSRERRSLFDVVYALVRTGDALEALGAHGWEERLDLWLESPCLDGLPFAVRAGCEPVHAEDLAESYGDGREDWLRASDARPPAHLRVNLSRTTRRALAEELRLAGIETEPVDAGGLLVLGRADLRGHPAFRRGDFEFQDAGSQRVIAYVEGEGRTVLDLCAGAGGKALGLADRGARVVATDRRRRALEELRRRARRAGLVIEVQAHPSGRYDRVLVDAPCSGSGVWRRHPEYRWRLREAGCPSALQLELLQRGAERVAPGGELIYATCSSLRAENEAVVRAFLERHPKWEPARPPLRLAPHLHGTDGMFAQALTRRRG